MRTEPGLLDVARCLACGGRIAAVVVGDGLRPKCVDCQRSPAEACLYKRSLAP